MWIEFSTEEQNRSVVDLPMKQRLPLVQGIPLLEETSRELLAIHQQVVIDYCIYNEKNQDLATLEATLTLPVEGQTIVEAIQAPVRDNEEVDSEDARAFLALFEKSLPKDKRTQGTKRRKTGTNTKQKTASQELIVQAPYTRGRMIVKFATFLKVMFLFFLLLGGFYLGKSVQSEPKIPSEVSEQLNNLEKQVQQQAKIDTFSRFFLSNYYTGTKEDDKVQEKIKRFVDKETLKEFRGTEEKIKSILPWEVKRDGSTWQVSYVINLQNNQEKITMQQVTFSIKEQEKQYRVMTVPKEESFEINQ
ncbi:TPA: hypothetical protein IWK89_000804 [Enterococcus faecium]|uniref:hypothetical protein n=1 Tax=Enterococcus faecium TaxID=1352 RepID=UPI0029729F0B|nr:hypothetical protein [Enterococcus faecium]HAP9673202.1 hypothetical protein [Enterococcus faecium]HAP9676480.1 hypothetical protein [Enterococcus faecium]